MAFLKDLFHAPARAFSFLLALIVGGQLTEKYETRGLVGVVLDGVKGIFRSITTLTNNQISVIALAFWAAVAVAAVATLTVAFLPAALAAVVGFTVAGVSIASLVGTSFIAQVAAVAVLAAAATMASVFSVATLVKTFNAIRGLFTKTAADAPEAPENPADDNDSYNAMAHGLSTGADLESTVVADADLDASVVLNNSTSYQPLFVAGSAPTASSARPVSASTSNSSTADSDVEDAGQENTVNLATSLSQ